MAKKSTIKITPVKNFRVFSHELIDPDNIMTETFDSLQVFTMRRPYDKERQDHLIDVILNDDNIKIYGTWYKVLNMTTEDKPLTDSLKEIVVGSGEGFRKSELIPNIQQLKRKPYINNKWTATEAVKNWIQFKQNNWYFSKSMDVETLLLAQFFLTYKDQL